MTTLGAIVKRGYENEIGRPVTQDEFELIISKRRRKNRNKPITEILGEGW